MAIARGRLLRDCKVSEAEAAWYDAREWPRWVDGLQHVEEVTPPWPEVSGAVTWRSGPYGRGEVREHAVRFEARGGQVVEWEDDRMSGTQEVTFKPANNDTRLEVRFTYNIKGASPIGRLVGVLFTRRVLAGSLVRTLDAFVEHLAAQRESEVR
jgi:Polyketide cyclase / dehydrase and lipid transport